MNKLLPVLFLLLSCVVSAEELKFITVLSSPVGSFNKLEAVDPTSAAQGTKVNFCTGLGNGGTVELKGAKDASLGAVNLSANTQLGRTSDGDYVLTNVTLNSGGSVEGSRLLSNVVNIQGNAVGKSTNLYSNSLTVAGAKTTGLNVNNKSIMSGTGSAEEMVWSNEYQSDTSCGTDCSKQYLLKQYGNPGAAPEQADKCVHCTAYDKGSSEYNNCVKNSVLTIDRQCCQEAQVFFPSQSEKEATKCWKIQQSNTDYYDKQEILSRSELTWRYSKAVLGEVNSSSFSCLGGNGSEDWAECTGSDFCAQDKCALSCNVQCSPFDHTSQNGIYVTSTWDCHIIRVTPACVGIWVNY